MTTRRALAPLAVGLLAACSGTQAPPAGPSRPTLSEPIGFVSPARWDHHPSAPSSTLARVVLAEGGCVLTAEGGQRWIAAGDKCGGKVTASEVVAPEELVSAIRRADGSWVFVGDGGTLFEAAEPLGPFTRSIPAPEPFVKVAGAGSTLLATTVDGRLLRWGAADGWRAASESPALKGVRVFDVAAAEGNRVMALGFPEVVLVSEDGGTTWSAPATGTIGARMLGRTVAGDLAAQGLFESLVFHPGGKPALARGTEKLRSSPGTGDLNAGRAPSAMAVSSARAVLDGDRYYEVVPAEGEEPASLARGRIDGRLELVPIPDGKACSNLRVGAVGKTVFVVCTTTDEGQTVADLRRSDDAGSTWSAPFRLATPDTDPIEVAASADGSVLVTGVCKVADGGGICKPSGPVLVRWDASGPSATASAAPQLSGPPRLPAFSLDGGSAYFLGRRGKDDRISLFVSHDGGVSFASRALEGGRVMRPPEEASDDDIGVGDEPTEQPDGPDSFDIDESSSLRPGEDGAVGMLLTQSRAGAVYVMTDPDGRVLQAAAMPAKNASAMAGSGRRVVAIASSDARPVADGAGGTLWESMDGGATWQEQIAPYALSREFQRGTPTLACSYAGCLIGETLTRVGWGGQSAPGVGERPEPPAPTRTPQVLTPISCEMVPSSKWTRIDGVYSRDLGTALPLAHVAMRGKSAWSVLTYDPQSGALAAVSATLPDAGDGDARLVTHTMFPAHPPSQRTAIYVSPLQVEGYAAVRAAVPQDAKGNFKPGTKLKAEVAWENYFEGLSQRARLPEAGPFVPGDVNGTSLHAAQLSVSGRGLIVRPHAAPGGFVVDATGKVVPYLPHPWPSVTPVGTRLDVRATAGTTNGELIDIALQKDRQGHYVAAALAKKPRGGSGPAITAASFLPERVDSLALWTTWSVSTKAPVGISAQVVDTVHNRAWAHFFGIRPDGSFSPPEPLPTPFDLPERPRPCSAAERAGTARFHVAVSGSRGNNALFPGTRHPVLVTEQRAKGSVGVEEPIVLLTADAILHGTPASPCLAGWEATGTGRQRVTTAILTGGLTRSWLFRSATDASAGKGRTSSRSAEAIEYRPMTCRYDPGARVPEVVWTEPGTFKIER